MKKHFISGTFWRTYIYCILCVLGDTGFFRPQGIVRLQFLGYLTETANRAESGQLQFWSEPSKNLNLRSSNTPETTAFTIP